MKNYFPYILLAFVFSFSSCKKQEKEKPKVIYETSKEKTTVIDSDGLEYVYCVDEINKELCVKFLPSTFDKEYRVEVLTYVYQIGQPMRHSTSKGNWTNRLNKCYTVINVTYKNGQILIK
jgi:hypothetical protein